MIRLARPAIGEEEIEAVNEVLRSGFLVQGDRVRAFEETVARYLGAAHAVAVSSGTAALHLALLALGIGPGDEVIVPDFTFPACANVVELAGARPVLADIDLATFNATADTLRAAISPRTRAVMPVHLFGQPADMDPIRALAREHRLGVVEDAACALGAEYRGRRCGRLGEVACFSFHPRKVITTGEGGMVVTDDDELARRIRSLRNHGMVASDGASSFETAGFNYRMSEVEAALGQAQMRRLDALIDARTRLARLYDAALGGIDGLALPRVIEGVRPVWQAYVVLLPPTVDRDAVTRWMSEDGIETTLGTYAVSAQPHYRGPALPGSQEAFRRSLCLPLHPGLRETDIRTVASSLARAVAKGGR
jgi:dTDP-4-amino-4,6-dideoxygalactose transaminase